jgi:hypothetical protein
MKKVLSQLHNAIIELEDNNLIKEASILNNLFVKLSAVDSMKYYRSPPLSDVSGEPNANITEFTSGHPKIDEKIHKSPSYQKLKNEWLISRKAYLVAKKTSALSNYTNPNVREQNEKKEENLRQNWIEAERILESWYMGAYSQVAAGRPIQEIKKIKMQNIDHEKRNRNRSTVKPAVKPTVKLVSKPETKPVSKPATPQPQVTKPKPVKQKATAPVTTNQTTRKTIKEIGEAEITNRAQEYLDILKSRVFTQKEKIWQAYAFLQFIVYREDTTTGKFVYRKWQEMVDEYKEQQQQQPTTTTTPSAPSTTQSNPSTPPTPTIEV